MAEDRQDFVSQKHVSHKRFVQICRGIIKDFDRLPIHEDMKKPRVGVVGEILVKFSPSANNHLVELLEQEGAEAVVPDLMDFLLYCFKNSEFKADHLGKKLRQRTHRPGRYPGHGMAPEARCQGL